MGLKFWCNLLCWPPCIACHPSTVAARISLIPPEPSYEVYPVDENIYQIVLKNNFSPDATVLRFVSFTYGTSKRGNSIACVYIKCSVTSKFILLYSHGNGVDIGDELRALFELGRSVGCDVFAYDYSGYGRSSGKPSEANLYADIDCAIQVLTDNYGVTSDRIVLVGRSIGSVPTIDVATKIKVAGLVLLCPLASALRTVFPQMRVNLIGDVYKNISKISKVDAPVLLIHGAEDEVIDISQVYEMHKKCSRPVVPLWVPGVGHNDLELAHFIVRFRRFVHFEIDGRETPTIIEHDSIHYSN